MCYALFSHYFPFLPVGFNPSLKVVVIVPIRTHAHVDVNSMGKLPPHGSAAMRTWWWNVINWCKFFLNYAAMFAFVIIERTHYLFFFLFFEGSPFSFVFEKWRCSVLVIFFIPLLRLYSFLGWCSAIAIARLCFLDTAGIIYIPVSIKTGSFLALNIVYGYFWNNSTNSNNSSSVKSSKSHSSLIYISPFFAHLSACLGVDFFFLDLFCLC